MSVAVAIDRLAEQVDALGPRAYFISFGADGKGHVVSVMVRLEGAALAAEVGRTTRANLGANPSATVLWPPTGDDLYCLIVDGTADLGDGDLVAVRPDRAVLHRLAGAGTDIPSCIPLEATD